jgi:outer membrane protein TolC
MARSPFRAHGPTESERAPKRGLAVALALAPACAGCVAYEPAPVDASAMLAELGALRFEPPFDAGAADPAHADGAAPDQLAAFAVVHNPSLRVLRAQIGVAEALLVEAGLLADPEIGWDGMDALAAQIVEGTTSSIDFVSGFGLSLPLPRPGELDAKEGAARWRVEEARRRVVQVEWLLARDVHVACEDVLEAQRLLEQSQDLLAIAETTRGYFERALGAGAATAIQANLAAGELLAIRAERVRLEAGLRAARQRLHALLGLPPATVLPLVPAPAEARRDEPLDPEQIALGSLSARPDLALLLASYQAAEEEVRLEVARQFPQISIGTGIWLVPGVFTRFNRPAIATAIARRAALRGEIEAAVHEVRREIHDAHAALQESRLEVAFLETELLPNAEESLRLARAAFSAGEVTVLEILSVQRALVDARTRTTEARAELERRRWRLLAASGTLLAPGAAEATEHDEREAPQR